MRFALPYYMYDGDGKLKKAALPLAVFILYYYSDPTCALFHSSQF